MRIRTAALSLLALLALALPALAGDGPPSAQLPPTPFWALAFENDTPKQLVLDDPGGKLRFFWYVVYRVTNPEEKPLPAHLRLSIRLSLEKQVSDFEDGFDRVAETHIEKKVLERKVCNWAELREQPLKPGESREGIAIFSVGREAPDFDKMVVSVRGLAELRPLGRDEKGRKFRERVLLLRYEQVSSQWRAGKELKYLPEEWALEEISLADRAEEAPEDPAKLQKKLDELLERARKEGERRKKIIEERPPAPPPAKSSAGEPAAAIVAGPPAGKPAPDLIAAFRKAAASAPPVRASFTEATGRDERRQEVSGTLCLARDGKFAIERNLHPGTDRAIKEQRVFDGAHLWIHTTAQGVGDTVRRWTVAATKKEWHTLEGRPEVDFASVANPARAWRVFADDLVFLGAERLDREEAYVFEVRPGKKHEALLSGPLTGELLGKALGRRVRFWIGKASAFQLRMQVYDERDQAIAVLDCADLSFDAPLPPDAFAFKPPAGVEVPDTNAAYAATEKP